MAAKYFQSQVDPFLCSCAPCKWFWQETFRDRSALSQRTEIRSTDTAAFGNNLNDLVAIGNRVSVDGKTGVVKFVGFIDDNAIAPSLHIGIKLDESVHMGHDGTVNGKRYFYCTNGHGILVKYKDITPLKPISRQPPLKGNPMFPSWPEICQRRKQREAMLTEIQRQNLNVSRPVSSLKIKPPAIPIRETRTQLLRREKTSGEFLIIRHNSHDALYKDYHSHQNDKKLLVASISNQEAQTPWEVKQKKQWKLKYGDAEKADRMGETLLKLSSAYKEGKNYQQELLRLQDIQAIE